MPVSALIEAANAYPAMERLVLSARQSVWLGFRIFDPDMKLISEEARTHGLERWGDLAAWSMDQGAVWRIRLTDFDPIGAPDLHGLCWRSVRGFQCAGADHPDRCFVLPALHRHELGWLPRAAFWLPARSRLARTIKALRRDGISDGQLLEHYPGLVAWLKAGAGGQEGLAQPRLWPPFALHPVVHHEKLMIVDRRAMILGGLDVNMRRFDDGDHGQPADQTWHDVSVQVDGEDGAEPVAQASDHFAALWNESCKGLGHRWTPDDLSVPEPIEDEPAEEPPTEPVPQSEPPLRFVRTVSRHAPGGMSIAPRAVIAEIEAAHLAMIKGAQNLLYIETQYLRWPRIAQALAQRAKERPELHVIVLLPAAPDDVAFEGNKGPDARHGAWLQARAVERIANAFGPRALFVSLAGAKAPSDAEPSEHARTAGQYLIYVHAKVMIADGARAIVSSANLNGRSMCWDTESGIVWNEPEAVAAFQAELWTHHFNNERAPQWREDADPATIVEAFREAALPHADTLLAPYPHRRARRFAASRFYVPNAMV